MRSVSEHEAQQTVAKSFLFSLFAVNTPAKRVQTSTISVKMTPHHQTSPSDLLPTSVSFPLNTFHLEQLWLTMISSDGQKQVVL